MRSTPTACSCLNAVEGLFATQMKRQFRRAAFASLDEPQAALKRFPAETNQNPRIFVWTAEPVGSITKERCGCRAPQPVH